jgi:hypothetical protein
MDPLDTLTSVLPAVFAEHEFSPLSLGVERHGSWEWSFCKRQGDLNRFVTVALTDLPSGTPEDAVYSFEVKVGAENDRNFVRRLVVDKRVRAVELTDLDKLPAELCDEIERGIDVAEQIEEGQLDESFLPRGSARTGMGGGR